MSTDSVTAWAICDTDGGRHEPRPLVRWIYTNRDAAKQHADMWGYEPEHYPIKKVLISVVDEGDDS